MVTDVVTLERKEDSVQDFQNFLRLEVFLFVEFYHSSVGIEDVKLF